MKLDYALSAHCFCKHRQSFCVSVVGLAPYYRLCHLHLSSFPLVGFSFTNTGPRATSLTSFFVCCPHIYAQTGAVYRGRYRHEPVAIKEFLTQSQAEAAYDEDEQGAPAFDPQVSFGRA